VSDRPQGAPFFWGGSAPHAVVLPNAQRPIQAVGGDRTSRTDCLGFVYLTESGSGRADRKEDLGIHLAAGG